ncbi:hypothetical protein EPO34_02430 [Patescibacteria group bacterium]|nr:MAG: hypothetical protein EPO34_02430 [Patescibacteria group bacterium]
MEEHDHDTQDAVHAGEYLLSWEVDEYPRQHRSTRWYAIASVLGIALIIYAIWTANFLFAVIVIMMGIITLLSTFRDPARIGVVLTTNGVVIGGTFHEYKVMKSFALVYEPPEVKNLYLDFQSSLRPLITIPLEDTDPNLVREALLPFLKENLDRTEETLTDVLQRVYKL